MPVTSNVRAAANTARTLTAVTGMNACLAGSLALGKLTGERVPARNIGCSLAFDLALAICDVRVTVRGSEHLDAARPAVFAFNHQSNLDPIIVAALIRRDFTATGKQEVKRDPASVIIALALDAILLDRGNSERGREQIARASDRLRGGESVMIAPEGTRNRGPEPGPFKLGAFHVARDAGTPIVPVVLHDTYDRMPRGAKAISPGHVDVTVLAPVATADWEAGDVRAHAERVREDMAATIAAGV